MTKGDKEVPWVFKRRADSLVFRSAHGPVFDKEERWKRRKVDYIPAPDQYFTETHEKVLDKQKRIRIHRMMLATQRAKMEELQTLRSRTKPEIKKKQKSKSLFKWNNNSSNSDSDSNNKQQDGNVKTKRKKKKSRNVATQKNDQQNNQIELYDKSTKTTLGPIHQKRTENPFDITSHAGTVARLPPSAISAEIDWKGMKIIIPKSQIKQLFTKQVKKADIVYDLIAQQQSTTLTTEKTTRNVSPFLLFWMTFMITAIAG